ncbi:uncharacterized protein LOC134236523 [Saccostrea cucullata]|uniref:uncharacterized protein LOC134236523 n=1 Tax=Saccostrea cuccullata TaxID=36930 RepID=UPI002ED62AED
MTSTFTLNMLCEGISFPASLPTITYVTSCPVNKESWDKAAKLKKCDMLNNYTSSYKYEYHCVLNKEVTKLLEVCVPVWFLTGNCARYSIRDAKIWNSQDTECLTFSKPCPIRYFI